MFKKSFTVVLPDEPYKPSVAEQNTITCKYTGARYLAICVHTPTGEVRYVARYGSTQAELQLDLLADNDPETEFYVLDAKENTFEAAYLQGDYAHDPIPDYVETLPNDLGTWSYTYSDNGVLSQIYLFGTLRYVNGEYIEPERREHAISAASFAEGNVNLVTALEAQLADPDVTDNLDEEEITKVNEYIAWIKSIPTVYAGIDHWKIPWPQDIPVIE